MDNQQMQRNYKKVVIVGAGFGGLNAVKTLGNQPGIQVVLMDRMNHHLFQPLLYQVAMAGLNPSDIAVPIRTIVAPYNNVRVYLMEAKSVDVANKIVKGDCCDHTFDYLIMACGANHSYFGHSEWEPYAPGLKTVSQATEIRRRVLWAFEMAERECELHKQNPYLTFVIVGGGPTGVELAGSLGEMARYTLRSDFRNIESNKARVILVEAAPRILGGFSPELSQKATRSLEQLGVQVRVSSMVTDITKDGVHIGNEFIEAATVVWAAGVQAPAISKTLGVPLSKGGLVPVRADLSITSNPDVFVIGDQAVFDDGKGNLLTGLSPIAMQQGIAVAKNIIREIKGEERRPFEYFDKGKMATIGRSHAVAAVGKWEFSGLIAWLAWLLVHIYYLIGFRNRLLVLIQWAISYATFKKGARLIIDKTWRAYEDVPPG
jgi:NADH dehydrogenase